MNGLVFLIDWILNLSFAGAAGWAARMAYSEHMQERSEG